MREGEQSDRIYVVVDSSKIARCKWCGIIESERWHFTTGESFCSTKCALAGNVSQYILGFILVAVSSPILLTMAGPMYMSTVVIGSLAMLAVGSPALILGMRGLAHRTSVPKNSRKNATPLDTALLRTVSTSVACPRCDANLDLRSIGTDRVYVCGYCGATGTIAVIDKRSGGGGSI